VSRFATAFVLGFHGCDRAVGEEALSGGTLRPSEQDFDWLGPGIYFWEADPVRAREWAEQKRQRGRISDPFVIGAIIDLGNCLDLLVRENLDMLAEAYNGLAAAFHAKGDPLPQNKDVSGGKSADKLLRFLDCAVIRRLHASIEEQPSLDAPSSGLVAFDSVRGLFTEGAPVYPEAGFHRLTHTQVAVRNPICIKGFFRPR